MSDHYFASEPVSEPRRKPVVFRAWGHELRLESASGVFASGRLDLGTAVLLRATTPGVDSGRFLDLGCGYGAIACAVAVAVPSAEVWAVDVNERALALCRDNAANTGVAPRLRVSRPGDVPADVRFDQIWSNPPIRIGKPALHSLLLTWLPRLAPRGRAVMVVGKNLGADSLQQWLISEGFQCRRLASAKGFRVLEVAGRDGR